MKAFFDVGVDILYPDISRAVSVEESEDSGRELGRGKGFVDFFPVKNKYFRIIFTNKIRGFEGNYLEMQGFYSCVAEDHFINWSFEVVSNLIGPDSETV